MALGNGLRFDPLHRGCWRRRIRRIKTTALTAAATGTNVTVVKTALQVIGNNCGHVRPHWRLAANKHRTGQTCSRLATHKFLMARTRVQNKSNFEITGCKVDRI